MASRPRTTARKTPRQQRSEATVEAILSATARVVAQQGFERATTNAIAERAGVSIGSLYQYFPNKEALVATLLERHLTVLTTLAGAALADLADQPLPVAARRLVDALFALYAVEPGLYRVFVEQLPAVGRLGRLRDLRVEVIAQVQAYLRAHRDELSVTDLELAATLVVHTLEALTHRLIADHPERLRDPAVAAEIAALVVRYLTG